MPCHDGPTQEDIAREKGMAGAKTALLCGVMQSDPLAVHFAGWWCASHMRVDEERAAGRPYSERAREFETHCEDILIAYNKARGASDEVWYLDGEDDVKDNL